MTTDIPSVAFTERIHGIGELTDGELSVPLVALTLERDKYDYTSPWRLNGRFATSDHERVRSILDAGDAKGREIRGETDVLEHFRATGPLLLSTSGNTLRTDVDVLEIGHLVLPGEPEIQQVRVSFTPTELAAWPILEPDASEVLGRLQVESVPRQAPFKWTCALGRFTFALHDEFQAIRVDGKQLSVKVPRATLSGFISSEHHTQQITDLLDGLARELRTFEIVASLLSRRRVYWTEIQIISYREQEEEKFWIDSRRWRSTSPSERPSYLNPLVVPQALNDDAIERLCSGLRALGDESRIGLAVAYFSTLWGSGFLEERVAGAFIAFEAVVNALPKPPDEHKGAMQQLLGVLRSYLRVQPEVMSYPDVVIARVNVGLSRLPDLHFATRAALVIEKYAVTWTDLWPAGVKLEDGIRAALRVRNDLVHTGHLLGDYKARVEAERIQILAERLVFRALGGKAEQIFGPAYAHIDWIRRELG